MASIFILVRAFSVFVLDNTDSHWSRGASAQIMTSVLGVLGFIAGLAFLYSHARFGYPIRFFGTAFCAFLSLATVAVASFLARNSLVSIAIAVSVGLASGISARYIRQIRHS